MAEKTFDHYSSAIVLDFNELDNEKIIKPIIIEDNRNSALNWLSFSKQRAMNELGFIKQRSRLRKSIVKDADMFVDLL